MFKFFELEIHFLNLINGRAYPPIPSEGISEKLQYWNNQQNDLWNMLHIAINRERDMYIYIYHIVALVVSKFKEYIF